MKSSSSYLTMNEYLKSAERILRKYNRGIGINDEDAISFVATYMMNADAKYDPTVCGEKSSRDGYRVCQAKYAVMHLRKKYRQKKYLLSLDFICVDDQPMYVSRGLVSNEVAVLDKVQCNEIVDIAKQILTYNQFMCFKKYYVDNETMESIGDDLGITRQAVWLHIINSKKKIRAHMNEK